MSKLKAALEKARERAKGATLGHQLAGIADGEWHDQEPRGATVVATVAGALGALGIGGELMAGIRDGAMAKMGAEFAAKMQASVRMEPVEPLVLVAQEKLGIGPFAKKRYIRNTPEKRSRRHNRRRRYK